ncbi:MAG: hypothetical protein ACOY3L_06310 [Pseudomonadota bacterium]
MRATRKGHSNPYAAFFAPIGELAVNFALLEKHLDWAIWVFLQTKESQWRAIVDHIPSVRSRIDLFATLCRLKKLRARDEDELEELLSALMLANDNRNAILHGQWGAVAVLDGGAQKRRYAARGKFKALSASYSPEQIRDMAASCAATAARLGRFMKRFDSAARKRT